MKYLIEIHHGIGDVVQMMGVVDNLFQHDPSAHITLILNKEEYKTLFTHDNRIKSFYRIDFLGMSKKEIIKNVWHMRREKFDYMFLSPISSKMPASALAILIGARRCFGEQLEKLSKISSKFSFVVKEDVHIVKRNENVLRCANLSVHNGVPTLCCAEKLLFNVAEQTIALCIGTSKPQKTWPLERYLGLASYFAKKGYQIVLLGGQNENNRYMQLGLDNSKWTNFMGKLSLIESATVASKCALVIGGDTGVMHMAAAVGAITLTLFSCTNPLYHCPFSDKSFYFKIDIPCQFCYGSHASAQNIKLCSDYKCVLGITQKDVIDLADKILCGNADKKFYFAI